jgi:hypothetical protein
MGGTPGPVVVSGPEAGAGPRSADNALAHATAPRPPNRYMYRYGSAPVCRAHSRWVPSRGFHFSFRIPPDEDCHKKYAETPKLTND